MAEPKNNPPNSHRLFASTDKDIVQVEIGDGEKTDTHPRQEQPVVTSGSFSSSRRLRNTGGPKSERLRLSDKRREDLVEKVRKLLENFEGAHKERVEKLKTAHENLTRIIDTKFEKSLSQMEESRKAFVDGILGDKLKHMEQLVENCTNESELLNFIQTQFTNAAKRLKIQF